MNQLTLAFVTGPSTSSRHPDAPIQDAQGGPSVAKPSPKAKPRAPIDAMEGDYAEVTMQHHPSRNVVLSAALDALIRNTVASCSSQDLLGIWHDILNMRAIFVPKIMDGEQKPFLVIINRQKFGIWVAFDGYVLTYMLREDLDVYKAGSDPVISSYPLDNALDDGYLVETPATESQPIVAELFELGRVVSTPGALEALERTGHSADHLLTRHASGDWGDALSEGDARLNNQALKQGTRIFSGYFLGRSEKIWIITEADRAATTLLLPDEY